MDPAVKKKKPAAQSPEASEARLRTALRAMNPFSLAWGRGTIARIRELSFSGGLEPGVEKPPAAKAFKNDPKTEDQQS